MTSSRDTPATKRRENERSPGADVATRAANRDRETHNNTNRNITRSYAALQITNSSSPQPITNH
jgi:hypothetical protein